MSQNMDAFAFNPLRTARKAVTDVVTDTVSGVFGEPLAAGMSLVDQALTDKSVDTLQDTKDKYGDWLNYEPRTEFGQAANTEAMAVVTKGVTAIVDFYKENEDKLGPVPDLMNHAIDLYGQIPEEYRYTIENAAQFAELLPMFNVGKLPSVSGPDLNMNGGMEYALAGDMPTNVVTDAPDMPISTDPMQMEAPSGIAGQAGSATTQVATTAGSYKKAIAKALEINPNGKTVLDYGAGLGLGTDAMRETSKMKVTSYEPFPERWKGDKPVDYTDSAKINTKFDTVVNLNVLNVLEPELRAVVAKDLMSKVKEGGVAIVGTRGWKGDVNAAKKATAATEDKALWIHKSSGDVYQKGFDGNELKDYMAELAPEGYRVERGKGIANNTVYVFNENKSGYNEGGLVDEMDSVDDFTLDGGLPKAATPYEGDRAALDDAVIEMRRIEADGPNPTFYAKDDQDFTEYGGIEDPIVNTPSVAITETEGMLTEAPVQSQVALDETGMDSREAAYVKPAMTQDKTRILNTLDALGPLEGLNHGAAGKLVNGRRTYNYGVEEATLTDMGIDRTAAKYKAADGTIDDKAVAADVAVKFHSTLQSKIPNWDKLPTEVYDAVFSLTWNAGRTAFKGYSLGTNLNKIATSKDTEAVKKAAYAAELKKNLLDVVGAKTKDASGNSLKRVQLGLANRRGRDYNLAAEALGVDKLTHYKVSRVLNEAEKDIGSKVEYFTAGSDTAIRTVTLERTVLEKERAKSGTKTPIG